MQGIADEIKASFRQGSVLTKLIYINLGVFIVVKVLSVFFILFNSSLGGFEEKSVVFQSDFLTYLMFPASPARFIFRPWSVLSYMFLHFGFLHILSNMLWLFWFGRIYMKYLTEKQLLTTYLLGGMAGAGMFMLAYNIFPGLVKDAYTAEVLGASASVTAIVMAVSFYAPNYTVYLPFLGPVKIKYIALVYLVLDIMQIASSNAGGHIAHLGGALYGYLFTTQLRKGKDVGKSFSRIADSVAVFFNRKPRMKVAYKSQARSMSDQEYNQSKAVTQKEIDRILDKIARAGYDSLSKQEKETLFKMSNKS